MADGFESFGSHLAEALASAPEDLEARVAAAAEAYRRWATSDRQRFALVFGLPAPGFALREGAVMQAFRAAMSNFRNIVTGAGGVDPPLVREVGGALADQIRLMDDAHRRAAPSDAPYPEIEAHTYQSLLHAWAAIHGFASLEAFGHLSWLGDQARDDLFRSQVTLLTHVLGARPKGR